MGRYSAGVLTGAGSTTLPIISLYGGVSKGGRIREIGITNTTSTAFAVKLVSLSTNGAPGAGITEGVMDSMAASPNCQAYTTHTIAPTVVQDLGYRAAIGAAVGAGVIWTFGDTGLATGATPNGVGVIVENGTGQAAQAYITWDE